MSCSLVTRFGLRVAGCGLLRWSGVYGGWLERLKAQGARLKVKTTDYRCMRNSAMTPGWVKSDRPIFKPYAVCLEPCAVSSSIKNRLSSIGRFAANLTLKTNCTKNDSLII